MATTISGRLEARGPVLPHGEPLCSPWCAYSYYTTAATYEQYMLQDCTDDTRSILHSYRGYLKHTRDNFVLEQVLAVVRWLRRKHLVVTAVQNSRALPVPAAPA